VALLTLVHLLGVASSLGSPDAIRMWHDAAGWVAVIVGVLGTVAAVTAFSRGDHLRRAWVLLMTAALLLLVGNALRSYWVHVAPGRDFAESPLLYPRTLVIFAANASATWALVVFASTYRKSGLTPVSTIAGNGVWLCLTVLALYLGGRQFGVDAVKMTSLPGIFSSLTNMASTLGDMATIILIVPILRVAYALRGGRLAWVWWAVGLSGAAWLAYDVRDWVSLALPGNAADHLELLRVFRTPGLALVGLAGFLQREALREPSASASAAGGVAPAL